MIKRFTPFLPELVALLIALLSGVLLFNTAIFSSLFSAIISVGLDPLRAQLIAALLMTMGAAIIGAAGGRRKLGSISGAQVVFCLNYLVGFIQLEQQPARDPGGNLEPLIGGALLHTSLVMFALALLSAFIGAAIGVALGDTLLAPPFRLARHAWQRAGFLHARNNPTSSVEAGPVPAHPLFDVKTVRGNIASWLGAAALALVIALVLAGGSGDLFLYSPDTGLHQPPTIPSLCRSGACPHQPAHGTLVQDSIVSSALHGQRKPFRVYLPPSYNTPRGKTKRYPALYLLHGSPGSDSDWFTGGKADQSADTLIALGKIPELILILPDGNGRPWQTSEWGNSFDQQQNIETYLTIDLVQYVDAKYRTMAGAANRGIGGISMGGFGAMNIAIHHPGVFGFVISIGGYYRAEGSIWGRNASYLRENSPIDVLPTAKPAWLLHMYIGAATKDQPYFDDAKQFTLELDHLHLPYQIDIQNGFHSWKIWQTQLYNALTWLRWGN